MDIALSTFDAIHVRPARTYNLATIELAISILFDRRICIPTPSLVDSPVFLGVFGKFLRDQQSLGDNSLQPIALRIDPDRHFPLNDTRNVMFRGFEAYLSGRAQTGQDQLSQPEFPLKHSFGFISGEHVAKDARRDVVSRLRREDDRVLELFSRPVQDNADLISRYFRNIPGVISPVGDLFKKSNYSDILLPRVQRYGDELAKLGYGSYSEKLNDLVNALLAKGHFNRNQLFIYGREAFESDWDKYFTPMINHNHWEMLADLMNGQSANSEAGASLPTNVYAAIVSTMGRKPESVTTSISFSREPDDSSTDGYTSPDLIKFDWRPLIQFRLHQETRNRLYTLKKEKDAKKRQNLLEKYVAYVADNLSPLVFITKSDGIEGRFDVKINRGGDDSAPGVALLKWTIGASTAGGASAGTYLYPEPIVGSALGGAAGLLVGGALDYAARYVGKVRNRGRWRRLINLNTFA